MHRQHPAKPAKPKSKPRVFRRTRVLVIGCGQVGKVLLEHHVNPHFTATYRSDSTAAPQDRQLKVMQIRQLAAKPILCDLSNPKELQRLATLGRRAIWLAPPQTSQSADSTIKQLLLQWRLRIGLRLRFHAKEWPSHSKRLGLAWTASTLPVNRHTLTYVSTTGVYGNTAGEWIDERSSVRAESARAQRRVYAESQIREGLKSQHLNLQILRAPGIYSQNRLPLDRIRQAAPALLPEEDSWSNHIHELDLARLCVVSNFRGGKWLCVNAVDQQPMKMGDYFDAVAQAFNLPPPPRLPAREVQAQVSQMMWSFMRESRKIRSINLTRLRLKLRYPTVAHTLASIKQTSC